MEYSLRVTKALAILKNTLSATEYIDLTDVLSQYEYFEDLPVEIQTLIIEIERELT